MDAGVAVCQYTPLNSCWKGHGSHHYRGLGAVCGIFCEKPAVLKVVERFPRYSRKFTARLRKIQHLVAGVHCRKWLPHMFSAVHCNFVLVPHSRNGSHSNGGGNVEPASSTAVVSGSKALLGSGGQDEQDRVVVRQTSRSSGEIDCEKHRKAKKLQGLAGTES